MALATIANAPAGQWVNADGLKWDFGLAEATQGKGGTYQQGNGSDYLTEFDVTFSSFSGATGGTVVNILDRNVIIPDGAVISSVTFEVGTAWDSTSSDVALNFGLIKRSDFATIIDTDGVVDSMAKSAIDTAGCRVVMYQEGSTTYIGALVGTVLAFDSVVCCYWETHAPTVGTGKLRIMWRIAN